MEKKGPEDRGRDQPQVSKLEDKWGQILPGHLQEAPTGQTSRQTSALQAIVIPFCFLSYAVCRNL